VRAIKETPEDRRIILTAWNPCALPEMALPPCHMMAQVRAPALGGLFCLLLLLSCVCVCVEGLVL
jgi:dihydrofolate reductase/thymidylate synthase